MNMLNPRAKQPKIGNSEALTSVGWATVGFIREKPLDLPPQSEYTKISAEPTHRTEDRVSALWDTMLDLQLRTNRLQQQVDALQSLLMKHLEEDSPHTKEPSDEALLDALVGSEWLVHMPPRREYTLRAKVRGIERAAAHVVEPEEFDARAL